MNNPPALQHPPVILKPQALALVTQLDIALDHQMEG
jgi:hypothetical protein